MISVVIPVKNRFDMATECIEHLITLADKLVEIIVIDNASDEVFTHDKVKVIRNEENAGFWPSMLQGIRAANNQYVLCIHSDVIIWEQGYDMRLLMEFHEDEKLGIVGFFGGRGVAPNGGRGHPEGNMIGRKYGTSQEKHGYWLHGKHPAVVFDSLAMMFDRKKLEELNPDEIPPHHWTDRLVTLRMITHGYRALTVGIAHDHMGTVSYGATLNTFAEKWCRSKGLYKIPIAAADKMNMNQWELALYWYGEGMFEQELAAFIGDNNQLWVNQNYEYYHVKQG